MFKVGHKKGNLTVLAIEQKNSGHRVLCRCSCGVERWFSLSRLVGYRSRFASCNINGHRFNKVKHAFSRKHQQAAEFTIWVAMRQRCQNKNDTNYSSYGGRGITVCKRWEKFENFWNDMGRRPVAMSLDRINNDGPYSPKNCRWASRKQQARNRRSSKRLNFRGENLTIAEWSERVGLSQQIISVRILSGWSVSRALTSPKQKNQYG